MVLLALIGGLPLANGQLIAAMSYAGSPQAVLYRCNHSMCSREDRNALRRWLDDEALRPAAAFTLALVSKRREGSGRGAFSEAKRMARTAYAHGETPQTDVLLGNLSYGEALEHCPGVRDEDTTSVVRFEKRLEAALEHWRLALEAAPTEVAALYNSSVVLRQLGNDDEADRLLEQATSVSPEEVTRYGRDVAKDNNRVRCQRAAIVNRHLMDPTLPTAGMRADVMAANVPRDGLVLTFAGLFTGRLGVRAVGMIGYAAAGLTLLLWLLGSLMSLSRSCTKCHDIADPSNRLDLGTRAVCGDCLLADVNRGIGDAKEQWARDQKIHAETLRRGRTPRILTWFLPGFGHLLRGAPVRGLLILALVFGCLLVGSGLNAVVHDPRQPLGVGSGRLFLFGAIAAVTYLLALIDAHTAKVT
jgi:tetratricopeptide (TPR) repeat protein